MRITYALLLFTSLLVLSSCGSSRRTAYTPKSTQKKSSRTSDFSRSIVQDARSLINRPYRYGGDTKKGFDCSGLVTYVYGNHNVSLPRRSADQARYGKSVSLNNVRRGDLIFFKSKGRINHVGIVSDTRGKFPSMIHSSSSRGVIEEDIDASTYWQKRYAFIRRIK